MINIAICDDQHAHLTKLAQMINEICLYKIPEKYDCRAYNGFYSAEDVISFLRNNMINILFLDIEMKGMNGFEYAPFRFLRKSRLNEELEPALIAAIESLMLINKKIELKTSDGSFETRLTDIEYFESEKNYLIAHIVGNKTYRFRNTITEIFQELKNDDFFKIHQAYVINHANIKRNSGYSEFIMSSGII